ncbi:MAG: cytochrome C [Deltaproteobacteria bacterium HGW-Deltaproteobacteria-4]|nr:MAG: cytochrome C [Deltaproteobacteria bacterium HGW-Deltaproteobacteria-4]
MPVRFLIALVTTVATLGVLYACSSSNYLPAQHPADVGLSHIRPICVDCHESRSDKLAYADFNHTPTFATTHRSVASRSAQVCAMCHQQSFCNECHATGIELKPSLKNQSETFRGMPHRGDYQSRHVIDGRLDPTSCYRCHGNPKASETCRPCHG